MSNSDAQESVSGILDEFTGANVLAEEEDESMLSTSQKLQLKKEGLRINPRRRNKAQESNEL